MYYLVLVIFLVRIIGWSPQCQWFLVLLLLKGRLARHPTPVLTKWAILLKSLALTNNPLSHSVRQPQTRQMISHYSENVFSIHVYFSQRSKEPSLPDVSTTDVDTRKSWLTLIETGSLESHHICFSSTHNASQLWRENQFAFYLLDPCWCGQICQAWINCFRPCLVSYTYAKVDDIYFLAGVNKFSLDGNSVCISY